MKEGILKEEQDPRVIGHAATFDTHKYLGNRNKKATPSEASLIFEVLDLDNLAFTSIVTSCA